MSHRSSVLQFALPAAFLAALLAACASPSSSSNEAAPTATETDAGTGAAPDAGDNATPPPELGDLASTVCLSNGTTRDPNAVVCNWNSDCKQQPQTDGADWDHGRWKKQCDTYSWMIGVSISPSNSYAEQYWCAMRPDLVSYVANWTTEGFNSAQRSSTSDWDPGYTKAECPLNQYMSGYSVNTSGGGTGSIGNIRCVNGPNEGNNTSCHGVTFPGNANAGYIEGSDDWSPGNYKLECAGNEHMAGMSTTSSSGGRIHGILCCSGGTPPSTSPAGAGNCCNNDKFPPAVSACTSNPNGNAAACNLVDYCCQTGVSSYAGSAACAEVAYAQDPSANSEGGSGITVGPVSSSAGSVTNGVYTLVDEYAKVRGNYGFGAGYDASISLSASKATLRSTGKSELKGYATLFGKNVTLADIEADGDSLAPATISAKITVVGMTLWSSGAQLGGSYDVEKSGSYTFFSQSKSFTVGPVPVTVSGAVLGTLAMNGTIAFANNQLSIGAGPTLDVTATASAALGGSFGPFTLEAGVDGSLTLFNAAIANTASVTPGLSSVAYNASSNLTLTELNGNINLFVTGKLNLIFVKYHKTWTYGIVSFAGAQQIVPIAHYSGSAAY